MTLDHLRNSYYSDAIRKVIDNDSVVLDLGAWVENEMFIQKDSTRNTRKWANLS